MINKLKIGFLIAVLSLAVGVGSARAADLTFSSNTAYTINGNTYIIGAGSGATSVVLSTDTTNITVVVPAATTFTLISANRHTLANDGGLTAVCTNTESTLTISAASTVVITPTTTACGPIVGSGGGGGGGYVPPGDTTPPTNASVSINAGLATTLSLSSALTLYATDATQMLISNDAGFAGASWENYVASKSWILTSGDGVKTVYVKFRDAAGNMSGVVSDSITVSGSGTVAPVMTTPVFGCSGGNMYNTSTGALCVSSVAQAAIAGCSNRTYGFSITTGASCVGNIVSAVASSYNFGATTLKNGSKGEAVMELQRFLNAKLNLGLVIDGKLGPKTIAVIKQWQKNYGLVADGLVGPKTKAMMNASVQ